MNPVNLDHDRGARLGFLEVIYGPSKPTGVLIDILHEKVEGSQVTYAAWQEQQIAAVALGSEES
jgi:NCAIR mutase (PurE)-related protein